jgi:pilus assembly protein CpaE
MIPSPQDIRLVVVDSSLDRREHLMQTLRAAPDLRVVGTASGGDEALRGLAAVPADVVLLDLHLPDVDGIQVAEAITAHWPWISVILVADEPDPEHLRRAMLAGARQFLIRPLSEQELITTIREVYRRDASRRAARANGAAAPSANGVAPGVVAPPAAAASREGQIFTFYSAKGGVGCTTLACNLAVALKQTTGKEVAIFDCGLLFGDVGVVLNLDPKQTIVDLLPHIGSGGLDGELLTQIMLTHPSGVKVLLAPPSPEKAELVTAEHVRRILVALREQFDYVVIDTWPTFEERILHVLDASDKIVVPTTLEMPAIKNCKLLIDVAVALAYPPEKVMLVLNRADSRGGIRVQDVEQILNKRFSAEIVSDGRLTTHSLNEGVPFVMTNAEAQISANITDLARKLAGVSAPAPADARPRRATALLRAVFGS